MSLTSFLRIKDVNKRFTQEFPRRPKFDLKKEILAPSITRRFSLVGTAFDYLMRFYLKCHYPDAIAQRWVAESALKRISGIVFDIDSGEFYLDEDCVDDVSQKAWQIVKDAKKVYSGYLAAGEMSDEVIKSTLLLAQLDPIYRGRPIDPNIGVVDKQDVVDLRKLISIVDPKLFKAKKLCMLNPTFGKASNLVGGADADLIIDDTLIEIKTIKDLKLERSALNQLIGYYVLSEIGGIGKPLSKIEIKKLGIYYSRYGELYTFPVEDVIDKKRLPEFTKWFKEKATETFKAKWQP